MNIEDYKEINIGMSNFDNEIDDGFSEALKSDKVFGRHSGWDFNGRVYWDSEKEKFAEDVYVYGTKQKTIISDSLESLMESVNMEFGYD